MQPEQQQEYHQLISPLYTPSPSQQLPQILPATPVRPSDPPASFTMSPIPEETGGEREAIAAARLFADELARTPAPVSAEPVQPASETTGEATPQPLALPAPTAVSQTTWDTLTAQNRKRDEAQRKRQSFPELISIL
jgi:hypothetical protein